MTSRERQAVRNPVLRFDSLHAAEMHLKQFVGSRTAHELAADLFFDDSLWGPGICSDGWHIDRLKNGEVKLRRCDCSVDPEQAARPGGFWCRWKRRWSIAG
jgi:hypothetical protein